MENETKNKISKKKVGGETAVPASNGLETKIYDNKGKESGTITLPEGVFNAVWKPDLVHQVVTSMLSSARKPIAHTKTRGEVSGGGKKPWKQKGTGRARHGSIRSPIWVGGGVAHGPRNDKNFERKVNKKMKDGALCSILSKKFKEGEVLFVDAIAFDKPKTKEAKQTLASLGTIAGFEGVATRRKNAAYIAVPKKDAILEKSFRNFSNIKVNELRNINPIDALSYKYIVLLEPKAAVEVLSARASSKKK